jgi:hypothetical protein
MKIRISLVLLALFGAQLARGDASYSEPVPPNLAAEATFAMPQPQWSATPEGQELRYALPADLVGAKDVEIDLHGNAPVFAQGFSSFSGPLARAICTLGSQTHVLCFMQYLKDIFGQDPAGFSADAQAFLKEKYSGALELPNRLEVQARFQNEPAGVLSFEIQ